MADSAIAAISQLLPNLAELSLQALPRDGHSPGLLPPRARATARPALRLLLLEITNTGVVRVHFACPTSLRSSLSGCSRSRTSGVELGVARPASSAASASWCPRITDMAYSMWPATCIAWRSSCWTGVHGPT